MRSIYCFEFSWHREKNTHNPIHVLIPCNNSFKTFSGDVVARTVTVTVATMIMIGPTATATEVLTETGVIIILTPQTGIQMLVELQLELQDLDRGLQDQNLNHPTKHSHQGHPLVLLKDREQGQDPAIITMDLTQMSEAMS